MRTTYRGTAPLVADAIKSGDGIRVHCQRPACQHSAPIDLAAVAAALGPEATFDDLRARLKCSKCGGREVLTIVSPNTKEYRAPQG